MYILFVCLGCQTDTVLRHRHKCKSLNVIFDQSISFEVLNQTFRSNFKTDKNDVILHYGEVKPKLPRIMSYRNSISCYHKFEFVIS